MSKTIVINGHRNPKDSVFGKALFESVKTLPEVTGHTLIQAYPDYKIDGEKERALLDQHGGANQFTLNEFLRPFEQTAKLCGHTLRALDIVPIFGVL